MKAEWSRIWLGNKGSIGSVGGSVNVTDLWVLAAGSNRDTMAGVCHLVRHMVEYYDNAIFENDNTIFENDETIFENCNAIFENDNVFWKMLTQFL